MHDDMQVKNEAVWALSNCTASANAQQYGVLVEKGLIKALGGILKVDDIRMLAVALEGLDNTLANGAKNHLDENGENKFAIMMEQEDYISDLEELQQHPNHTIYQQALKIIDKYFQADYDDPLTSAIDSVIQNQSNGNGGQPTGATPMGQNNLFDV
jgi:importin subunit alpha-6/7